MDSSSLTIGSTSSVTYQLPQSAVSANIASTGSTPLTPVAAPTVGVTSPSPVPGQSSADTTGSTTSSAALKKTAEQLNQSAQPQYGSLQFKVDHDSGKMVLQVVDKETNNVLLQIPSKEALILSETIGQGQAGSLIKESA